ncbi:MAG: nucleotidyltransferase domain-containing protein [Bacilli bacterium]|jgi:predicted nucleotidyltransferase|nr:nucleotidyltransferase domain-containing protein [Bacilli bacterium]
MELYEIRKKNGISQLEAAKILHVSRRSYQSYELRQGANRDKYDYLCERLEKAFLIDEEHGILTVNDIRKRVLAVLAGYEYRSVYLFGSYSKGKAGPKSDVDLLIDTDVTGIDFFGLAEDLREKLGKKVDLLNLDQFVKNKELMSEVLHDGVRLDG